MCVFGLAGWLLVCMCVSLCDCALVRMCACVCACAHVWLLVWERARACLCVRAASVCALYDGFADIGLEYGPGYRTLVQVWGGGKDALARLGARATHEGARLHPADLDDALCTSAVVTSSDSGARLPFALDDARLQGSTGELWAVRRAVTHEHPHLRPFSDLVRFSFVGCS